MAVVAEIDNIDLVVEPHEFSAEDREAMRRAVEQHRREHRVPQLVQEAANLLSQRNVTLLSEHRTPGTVQS